MSEESARRYKITVEDDEYFAHTANGSPCTYRIGYAHRVLIEPVLLEGVPIYTYAGIHAEYALLGIRALRDFVITIDCKEELTRLVHIE